MYLENLNLEELNAQEVQETEGGMWPSIGWWMDTCFGYGSYYGNNNWLYGGIPKSM